MPYSVIVCCDYDIDID